MSKRKLREEKNCLNCGTIVEDRYCPNCGQENIEIRPSFRKLFTQFFIDFVNYDDGFLRTFKMILIRPGITIKEFLEGKRQRNFPPAKMVVFVSFFAFLLPFILPNFKKEKNAIITVNKTEEQKEFTGYSILGVNNVNTIEQLDSIRENSISGTKMDSLDYAFYKAIILEPEKFDSLNYLYRSQTSKINFSLVGGEGGFGAAVNEKGITFNKDYKDIQTVEDFEKIDKELDEKARMNWFVRSLVKKEIDLHQRGMTFFSDSYNDMIEKAFISNLSKVTFVYMPLFALLLALFHSRKKWKLYDHGIFTLYYFAFLLILFTLITLFNFAVSPLGLISEGWGGAIDKIQNGFRILSVIYVIYYFYRAHRIVYQERKGISWLKSTVLLFLNLTFIVLLTLVYSVWTLLAV